MNKTKQVLILAIIVAVSAVVGMIAINPFGPSSVQANQGGRNGAQKWEYCAIISAINAKNNFGQWGGLANIRYFQIGGRKEETVEVVPDIGKRYPDGEDALAKAIAKLGEEGWEIIMKEPNLENRDRYIFYFKRPKQ